MRFIYPAVITKMGPEHFKATFPDLEGCVAEGDSVDDVIENANEAAAVWIDVELEENRPLPKITDLRDIPLEDGQIARNICVNYRFNDGWDE